MNISQNLRRNNTVLSLAAVIAISTFTLGACSGSSSSTEAVNVASDSAAGSGSSVSNTNGNESTVIATTTSDVETKKAGGSKNSGGKQATGPERKAFTDCLAENGVTLPEGFALPQGGAGAGIPDSIPANFDVSKMQTAMAACGDKLPAGAALPGAGQGGPDISAFLTCLGDNGVSIGTDTDISKLPVGDPKFTEAAKTCQPLLPAGLPGPSADGAAVANSNVSNSAVSTTVA